MTDPNEEEIVDMDELTTEELLNDQETIDQMNDTPDPDTYDTELSDAQEIIEKSDK